MMDGEDDEDEGWRLGWLGHVDDEGKLYSSEIISSPTASPEEV